MGQVKFSRRFSGVNGGRAGILAPTLVVSGSIEHGEPLEARSVLGWRGFLVPSGRFSLQELDPCTG